MIYASWPSRRHRFRLGSPEEPTRRVYYARRADGLIKIGVTYSIKRRLANLKPEHGPLELLGSHVGGVALEMQMHQKFRRLRVEGEWFEAHPDLLGHIESLEVAS